MKIITVRGQIRDVFERYRRFVEACDGRRPSVYRIKQLLVYERLRALDVDTATAATVEEFVGPSADVRLVCNECGQERPVIAEFTCEYDDGEYGAQSVELRVCADCLRKAADAIDAALTAEGVAR